MIRRRLEPKWTSVPALLLLLSSPVLAGDEPTRLPLTVEQIRPRVEWFGVYMAGGKSGHAVEELRREGDRYVVDLRMELKLTSLGEQVRVETLEVSEYEAQAPYRFVEGRTVSSQGPSSRSIRVVNGAETLTAVLLEGDRERTLTRPAPDLTLADALTPQLWIHGGPEVGAKLVTRTFSLDELEEDRLSMTVTAVQPTAVAGVKTHYYECRIASDREGELGLIRLGAEGELLSWVAGGLLELRSEPEELARMTEYSADLFVLGMVKIDKPLGKPDRVRTLVLEVDGEGTPALRDGPGQRVERREDRLFLHIGPPATHPLQATERQIARALEATVNYPVGDARVVEMAQEAVGDADTDVEKVARLVAYVSDYVEDRLGVDSQSVGGVIDRRAGDCTEHALLFTSLARAAGIPAREAGGLSYMGDEARAFGGHAWNEVVLDGHWVPVDPTLNQVVADAFHVRLEGEEDGRANAMSTFGRLEFRLVDVKRGKKRRPKNDRE